MDLPLLPTAYRESRMPIKGYGRLMVKGAFTTSWDCWTYYNQAKAELKLIRQFYDAADRAGLSIPEDSYQLRQLLRELFHSKSLSQQWPPPQLWTLIAVAQHYGIPTRFLDWTRSPYVAAYFAAESILRQGAADPLRRALVIWAFDLKQAGTGANVARDAAHDPDDRAGDSRRGIIQIIQTPYASSRNLAAQQGVHMLYRSMEDHTELEIVRRDSFDDELRRAHMRVGSYAKALYKFMLPAQEAAAVLRLLAKHGVTGATMFPGFDGVTRSIWERHRWDTNARQVIIPRNL